MEVSPEDRNSSEHTFSGLLNLIGMLFVAFAPPLALILVFSASFIPIAIGSAAWIVALGIKIPSIRFVDIILGGNVKLISLANGITSALTELGVSAFCFFVIIPSMPLVDVIGFGVGASSIEVLFTIGRGMINRARPDSAKIEAWFEGSKKSQCVRYMTLIERIVALFGHVGSRGLVYLSIVYNLPFLAAIALITFSVTDGAANYGLIKKWNWFDPVVCRQFYLLLLLIALIEIGIFVAAFSLFQA